MNVRGYNSKKEKIIEIIDKTKADVVTITETNFKRNVPKFVNYNVFFRNRSQRHMGGVMILIHKKFKDVVQLEEGSGENEYVAVKINDTVPEMVVFGVYGTQSGSYGHGMVERNMKEMFGSLGNYVLEGCEVVLTGDINLKIGDGNVNSNENTSKNGRLFKNYVKEFGLEIVNNLKSEPYTFVDPKSKNKSLLDVIITNNKGKKQVFIDKNKIITPYTVTRRKG